MRKILHSLLFAKRHIFKEVHVKEIDIFKKYIANDAVCIDVGAHGGSWSIPLSKICVHGNIFAFEALPYYADVLKKTLFLLRRNNVEVINKAVMEVSRDIDLKYKNSKGKSLTGLTHISPNGKDSGTVRVEGTTLDTFIKDRDIRRIDFLKIDVEGFELFVLKGAENSILKYKPLIYCEIMEKWTSRYGYKPHDIFNYLNSHGYKVYHIDEKKQIVEYDFNLQNQSPPTNFFFAHSDFHV